MPQNEKWMKWLPWDWGEIEEIIASGKTPTTQAIATALRGDQPIPKAVREFIAAAIKGNWPGGAPKKRTWEKEEERWKKDNWQMPEANLEFVEVWALRELQKNREKGMSFVEALIATEAWSKSQEDQWRHMSIARIGAAYELLKDEYALSSLPNKTYDEVIDMVAEKCGIGDPGKLKNRDKIESRRKSK